MQTLKTRYVDIPAYVTKDGSVIRELLHPQHHAAKNQSLAEATVPAGSATALHRHQTTEEIYHVTAGAGWMTLGSRVFPVAAGDTVLIPPGTPHCIAAAEAEPLRILCCCSPAYAHEDTELLTSISAVDGFARARPAPDNAFASAIARLLVASHRTLLQRDLLDVATDDPGRALYEAPLVVLAHDASADPVFFYGNLAAQRLFEMDWDDLVRLPSRFSAEPLAREERQRLLDLVSRQGYMDNYSGVRIARSGKRFRIQQATVWNLLDAAGQVIGQAAAFRHWSPVA